jgi:uncharacterized glyoxalase superfamily protein PhnB
MKTKKFIRCNPHLPVRDLRQTLDYYRDVLGFYDEWTWTNKEGRIVDGGIRRDKMRLLFAEDTDFADVVNNKNNLLPLMWFVENIDKIFSEFKGRNIEITDALRTHNHQLREFSFIDINGYHIRIAEAINEKE